MKKKCNKPNQYAKNATPYFINGKNALKSIKYCYFNNNLNAFGRTQMQNLH
ncbi:hypothetical protein X781_14560 [Mannheimia sp. USDA-ARS-USMARC-1261]|nr:hypothetical protein X781_14560 [Mannheimia sp. USDA-ARS-USMARC-1261]